SHFELPLPTDPVSRKTPRFYPAVNRVLADSQVGCDFRQRQPTVIHSVVPARAHSCWSVQSHASPLASRQPLIHLFTRASSKRHDGMSVEAGSWVDVPAPAIFGRPWGAHSRRV